MTESPHAVEARPELNRCTRFANRCITTCHRAARDVLIYDDVDDVNVLRALFVHLIYQSFSFYYRLPLALSPPNC